jgi:hypothetical protein
VLSEAEFDKLIGKAPANTPVSAPASAKGKHRSGYVTQELVSE